MWINTLGGIGLLVTGGIATAPAEAAAASGARGVSAVPVTQHQVPLPVVRDRRVLKEPGTRAVEAIPVLDGAVVDPACPLVPSTLKILDGSGPKYGEARV